jgi:hypothetical protein
MAKTVSFTLESPITKLGRILAKRAISKSEKKIEKEQQKIAKLNGKYFKNTSTTQTETTEKIQATVETVEAKFGNKIIFAKNQRNSFYHADKGLIDGKFLEFAKSTKWLNTSPNPKDAKQTRVFFNHTGNGQKALFTKQAKKAGFEIEFS